MEQKNKIGVVAFIFALLAIAAAGDVSTFWANVQVQPQLNESVTFIPGQNITLSQDTVNKTITITGVGGGNNYNITYDEHTKNFSNPHDVTANQINFGNPFCIGTCYLNDTLSFDQIQIADVANSISYEGVMYWINLLQENDNNKVNKTGDNVTGVYNFSNNIFIEKNKTNMIFWNGTGYEEYLGSIPLISNSSSSPLEFVIGTSIPKNANHVVEIWGGVNELLPSFMKTPLVLAYGGIEIYADDVPTSALSIGNNVPGLSATKDFIIAGYLASQGYWTQYFTVNGTTRMMTATNITVSGLSGTGNDYVCVDSTGKLYRSTAAC